MFRRLFETLMTVIAGEGDAQGDAMDSKTDDMLESMDAHVEGFPALIRPSPRAPARTSFTANVPANESGPAALAPTQLMRMLPVMLPLMRRMKKSAAFYDPTFTPKARVIPEQTLAAFEAEARALGVCDIGYVDVPPHAIFEGKGIPYPHAIVFTVEMARDQIETAPSFECLNEVMRGYKSLATIGNRLAALLQEHGFAACPGTALGGLTDYPHLAELAGLGAIGYHGLLITPGQGARVRINTIYTNIENLPVERSNARMQEHEWVRDFCSQCKKCVRACPVNAIYDEPRPRPDGGMKTLEYAACRDYFAIESSCAICLARCPFSDIGYEVIEEGFTSTRAVRSHP